SGRVEPAAAVCGVSARHLHVRRGEDGTVRVAGLDAIARMGGGCRHQPAERLALVPDVRGPLGIVMYRRILVAIENSAADRTILTHVEQLARMTGAELLLVHVADGVVARHLDDLELRESEEMREDRAYLERLCAELGEKGFAVKSLLAAG